MTDTPPQPRAAPDDLPHVPDWVIERGVNPDHYRAAKRIEGRIFGPYQWQDQQDRAASMVVSIIEALTEATEPLQATVRELRAEVERLRPMLANSIKAQQALDRDKWQCCEWADLCEKRAAAAEAKSEALRAKALEIFEWIYSMSNDPAVCSMAKSALAQIKASPRKDQP